MNSEKNRIPFNTIDLGRSGLRVTELGLGGIPIMRLGMDEAVEVVRHSYELGIRFFDTAHFYGDSEEKMGRALEPFREDVVIATKVWARDKAGASEQLAMSFERLRTERIDLIQCHNVSKREDLEKILGPGGSYEVLVKAKEEGRVGSIGFSSHNPDTAVRGCNSGRFDTLQFPFNFIEHDPLENVFPAALEKGMGIIAMKPLGGGLLNRADLCFRFLQGHPRVVPIAGIQAVEEIDEIVGYYRERRSLRPDDLDAIRNIREELGGRFCHRCEYCMPCEQGVKIPLVLMIKTQVKRFPVKELVEMAKKPIASAENCIECGECTEKCPYNLPVPEMLRENREIYERLLSEI